MNMTQDEAVICVTVLYKSNTNVTVNSGSLYFGKSAKNLVTVVRLFLFFHIKLSFLTSLLKHGITTKARSGSDPLCSSKKLIYLGLHDKLENPSGRPT